MHLSTEQLQNALDSIIATHSSAFTKYKTDVAQRYELELQKNQMQALEQIKETLKILREHGGIQELVAKAKTVQSSPELF